MSWSGRLEVQVNGEWGTICDREFDMKEANIACRALGYGSAESLQIRAFSGRGVGKIHYSALRLVASPPPLSLSLLNCDVPYYIILGAQAMKSTYRSVISTLGSELKLVVIMEMLQ